MVNYCLRACFAKMKGHISVVVDHISVFINSKGTLAIIAIEDDVVLVKTSDAIQTELLLGQIKGKKIVREELSSTALIIDKNKIFDLITYAEKLNMIVKMTVPTNITSKENVVFIFEKKVNFCL